LFPLATARSAKAVQMTTATDMRHNAEAFLDRFPESLARQRGSMLRHDPPKYATGIPFVIDPMLTDRYAVPHWDKADANSRLLKDYFGVWTNAGVVWPHLGRLPAPDTASTAALAQSVDTYIGMYNLRFGTAGGPVLTNNVTLTLPATVRSELSTHTASTRLATLRLVFESADGRSVQIRTPSTLTSTALTWTQPIQTNPLPLAVRIENQDPRYSWLLAVRQIPNTDLFDVDVVTYFQRPNMYLRHTSPSQPYPEQMFRVWSYDRTKGPVGEANLNYGLQAGQSQYVVMNEPGSNGTFTPVIRRGSFLLDGENNRWYRIANVKPAFPVVNQTLVYLDTPVIESNKAVDNNGKPTRNYVMFPRGVVDVFPLGVRK